MEIQSSSSSASLISRGRGMLGPIAKRSSTPLSRSNQYQGAREKVEADTLSVWGTQTGREKNNEITPNIYIRSQPKVDMKEKIVFLPT